MEKLELTFAYDKETKNNIRYTEGLGKQTYSSRDIVVGNLYVQKEAMGGTGAQKGLKSSLSR